MAKVTITLTLTQAQLVRSVVEQSVKLSEAVISDRTLEQEYRSRGAEGRREWESLCHRHGHLEAALREMA